jgi:hypothetical protein
MEKGSKLLMACQKGHPVNRTASNDCLPYEKKLIS